MPLTEIWCGGQTGERAAWFAAVRLQVGTGGWMPAGFRAADRDHPEYGTIYGARETTETRQYPLRTWRNIEHTDGTLLLAVQGETDKEMSPGSALTYRHARHVKRPLLVVPLYALRCHPAEAADDFRAWVWREGIRRLNVAGPRDADETLLTAWLVDALGWALVGAAVGD